MLVAEKAIECLLGNDGCNCCHANCDGRLARNDHGLLGSFTPVNPKCFTSTSLEHLGTIHPLIRSARRQLVSIKKQMAGNVFLLSEPHVSVQSTSLGSRIGSSVKVPSITTIPSALVTTYVLPIKVVRGAEPNSSAGFVTPSASHLTCIQVP